MLCCAVSTCQSQCCYREWEELNSGMWEGRNGHVGYGNRKREVWNVKQGWHGREELQDMGRKEGSNGNGKGRKKM